MQVHITKLGINFHNSGRTIISELRSPPMRVMKLVYPLDRFNRNPYFLHSICVPANSTTVTSIDSYHSKLKRNGSKKGQRLRRPMSAPKYGRFPP
jgi:hypothetical protein